MAAIDLLEQLGACGVSVTVDCEELVLRPGSNVPSDLLAQVKEYKAELIKELSQTQMVGYGQPPPPTRPPTDELELRRLVDALADPTFFATWMGRIMAERDPAEPVGTIESLERRLGFSGSRL